jgi:GABA permease
MAWKANVLVVANVTAASAELVDALRARAEAGLAEFTLVVPATGGGRAGREAAERSLEAALQRLRDAGLEVQGEVGDPDPLIAVKEIWNPGEFDEIVVSTLPTHASRWLLIDLPHRIERLTDAPVTHVVASEPRREPGTVHVEPSHEHLGLLRPLEALGWAAQEERPERRAGERR